MTSLRFLIINLLIVLALALLPVLAQATATENTEKAGPDLEAKPRVVSVKMALTQPHDFADERVMLVGLFLGFNGSCKTARPVSSGDVMVQDKQGLCIYVNGPIPEAFDPINKTGLGETIVLTGFVIAPEQGPPYFKIPYTKDTKNNTLSNARAMLLMRKQKTDEQAKLLTLEQLLRSPDKFVEKYVALKGLPADNTEFCRDEPAPMPDDSNDPSWIMRSQNKQCIRVIGQQPRASEITENPDDTPVTIKGYLYKNGEKFLFFTVEEKQTPKEPVIEMNTTGDSGDSTPPATK